MKKLANKVLNILETKDIIKPEISSIKGKGINFKSFKFSNVSFKYRYSNKFVLENINFEFKQGEKIGIIGKTGSGKSTFIDLIMGLFVPTSGKVFINNKEIYFKNLSLDLIKWRDKISLVPQNIYLMDDTLKNNIAFGYSNNKINSDLIAKSAEFACINEYIDSLENKYETLTGENGIQLSGGQRQRIGIARALYKDP